MAGRITDSPADILRELMTDNLSIGKKASSGNSGGSSGSSNDWPIYVSTTPDSPDNIMILYDTEGVKSGKQHATGKMIWAPGFQCMVRSNNYEIGYEKTGQIVSILNESVKLASVGHNGRDYEIANITITSGPLSVGREDKTRRYIFSLNGTISMRQLVSS